MSAYQINSHWFDLGDRVGVDDKWAGKLLSVTMEPGSSEVLHVEVRQDDGTAIAPIRPHRIAPVPDVAIRLVAAGIYEVLGAGGEPMDPPTQIVRSEWEGPGGGKRVVWEVATHDQHGWTIHGAVPPGATLREVRDNVALAAAGDALVSK